MLVGAAVLALLPWWRNHQYLRDFMDYGLVMSAVAQIDAGLRPYVDFATPVQCATFWINGAAESLFGGTYQAMTWGNAVFIVTSLFVLVWLLSRRWPVWAAIPAAWAIVAGSASQHTIVWYNAVGGVALAVAACAGALAPVLRRQTIPLHVATAAALLLGGVNKLNFHLVALAVVAGWALRARLRGEAGGKRLVATLVFVVAFGLLLPFAAEWFWTGASPAVWWHNVLELPAARTEYFLRLAEARAYLQPIHDYYGPLAIPQIGLAAIVLIGASVIGLSFPRRRRLDALVLPAAGLLAIGATLGLLATNHEIGYVTLATVLALTAALHLGFATVAIRPAQLALFLVLPALLCGAVFSWSAWQGQRSQFGHSGSPRTAYRDGAQAVAECRYLAGTLVPPEFAESLAVAASLLPPPNAHGLRPVVYGPGLEFLEHVWPATKTRGLPLWVAEGTTCRERESDLLAGHFGDRSKVSLVLVSVPWEQWIARCRMLLAFGFTSRECGGVARAYRRREAEEPIADPLAFLQLLGGNIHPAFLALSPECVPITTADGRNFLGVTHSGHVFRFTTPSNRLAGTVVIHRMHGTSAGPLTIPFVVRYTRADAPPEAWRQELTLPANVDEVTADFLVDARQQALDFVVEIPSAAAGTVCAGWFAPRVQHAQSIAGEPPSLFPAQLSGRWPSADEAKSVMPTMWNADAVFVRGGTVVGDQVELPAGGELWLHAEHPLAEFLASVSLPPNSSSDRLPIVRLVWYKGGRIEILSQSSVRTSDHRLELRAWSAEPDGWIGILIDPTPNTPSALVHIDSARLTD